MKKLFLAVIFVVVCFYSNAQVLGTAQTLKKGTGSVGIVPGILVNSGNNEFLLFLQGGLGISNGIDLGLRLGVLGDEDYIGADVEFSSNKHLSLAAGAHSFYDFGLDLTGLYTFYLNSNARFTTGLDMDVVFAENETVVPLWIPLNLEVGIKKNLVFMLEADIDTGVFDEAYHIISGGVQFYF